MKQKQMNDEALSVLLTQAYDAHLDAALSGDWLPVTHAAGGAIPEPALSSVISSNAGKSASSHREDSRSSADKQGLSLQTQQQDGGEPVAPAAIRSVSVKRARWQGAMAAVLALAILGGGVFLGRRLLSGAGSKQPAPSGLPAIVTPQAQELTWEDILARAKDPAAYPEELIFDDYVGAVQRCLVFRGDYGYCCVIKDVYDAEHFFGIFLFDADRRLTETTEGRAVAMPEGEDLDAAVLGKSLDEAKKLYGEPLFDAGSGLYIPTWFTTDGRLVTLHGVDDLLDPVARIESRNVLTEGSLPVQTDRLTDERLGEIFDLAAEDGDLDALVREYQGVVIRQTEYFNSAADRTALFYGKTKLLLVSEEQTEAGKTKLSRYLLPLSASAASFDGIRPGTDLEDVHRLDPDGGVYPFAVSAAPAGSWYSSHYTEDGWLVRITYMNAPQDPGLVVERVTRTRLAYVYTYYAQEPAETKTEIEHYSDEEIESLYTIIQDDPMSTEEKITLIRLNKGFFGTTVNDEQALWSYAYIYGKTELLYLSWPAEAGDDRKVSGCLFPLSPEKSVFEAITPGTSLEEVRTLDPDGQYLFLYTGVQLPPGSTHYTEDGYVVAVAYRNEGNGLVVERVECTHIPDLAPLPPETEPVAYDAPVNAAIDFLTLLARNEYLYENNTLIERTVAALPEEDRQAIKVNSAVFAPYTELRKVQGLPVGDHVDYILEKQAYWRRSRQEQGITHENFVPTYTCRGERISDGVARIIVEENLTWYYTGHSEPSALEVIHEVFLYEYDGAWYVFDVFSDDGYDCTHKADLSQAGDVPALTEGKFRQLEADRFLSPWGEEYVFLCGSGILDCFGNNFTFVGGIEGQPDTYTEYGKEYEAGFFAVEGSKTNSILIRTRPDSEWSEIYRKASLPPFDYSVDRCIRLELLPWMDMSEEHLLCGDGITDRAEIAAFLADVRAQKSPKEAGLYDLVRNEQGILENCYVCGYIYGSFAEEPNLVLMMDVTSYNDLAYSVSLGTQTNGWPAEYVLPEEWIPRLLPPGQSLPKR